MYISVPIDNTMEVIQGAQVSPFVSKGVCKVCYVGQEPNRNGTVITKEVAAEMGRNLLGSPVVGYYDEKEQDFAGHERELVVQGGKFKIVDMTKPYGFVPTDGDVWFQKFEENGIEREYLVTDVYLWTGVYPEAQRILDKGNNQSMELSEKNQEGFWTNDDKTKARIFIYNEALIEKLCILGENVEPCFEGAQIKAQFSLADDVEFQQLKSTLYSMVEELQGSLSKGGSENLMDNEEVVLQDEYVKKPEEEEKPDSAPKGEEKEEETPPAPPKEEEEEEPKKKYNLEEIEEYTALQAQYDELQAQYSELSQAKEALDAEVESLREFKLSTERQNKQNMIDSFYMLSDADKKDVVEHIDTYSLDDIEAKLSVICVRNKVSFNLDNEEPKETPQGLFNLQSAAEVESVDPVLEALRQNAKAR